LPHVAQTAGTLCEQTALDASQPLGIPLRGWPPESFLVKQLELQSGRRLAAGDRRRAMLGAKLAAKLKKSLGDHVELAGAQFEVVGLFEERDPQENQAAVVPLADLQQLLNRPGQVSEIWIRLEGTAEDRTRWAKEVEPAVEALCDPHTRKTCGLVALPARELVSRGADVRLARALTWAVCVTVALMGTLGVVNAMAQNVHERRRELGALRAIGWGRRRIVGLILSEAGALSVCGALCGAGLGWLLLVLLSWLPGAQGAVRGELSLALVAMALIATPLLGLAGGLIPAQRAAQLIPCEALRHE
jgi:putative ABC transport system permease protein